jgi:hypothetical protein
MAIMRIGLESNSDDPCIGGRQDRKKLLPFAYLPAAAQTKV